MVVRIRGALDNKEKVYRRMLGLLKVDEDDSKLETEDNTGHYVLMRDFRKNSLKEI